jgi:putative restriction endonuclease
MKTYVGVTDNDWFRFLSLREPDQVDEVNFWQPGAHGFKALQPGEPFLFKLHYPENAIAGGGFFAGYSRLPCGLAWEAFREKNGVADLPQMLARIEHYKKLPATVDTEIGCVLLEQPFFFPRDEWIPAPSDWSKNIVSGKTYDLAERTDLWEAVQYRLIALSPETAEQDEREMFTEGWVRQRLGQGSFRALVTQTYERRCAVTREKILPVLQAAHIRPVTHDGPHRIENGLLLRSDVHTLFDRGYLTLERDRTLRVSPHLRADFDNGEFYYSMDGSPIWVPDRPQDQPAVEFLEWHRDVVFRA